MLCFTSAFHLVVCVDCLVFGRDTVCCIFAGDKIDNSVAPTCVVAFSCVCCSKCGS